MSGLPLVMADRRRIVQVLVNLLTNAAKHSPEVSPIRVAVAWEAVHVAFSVADHGTGLAADLLPTRTWLGKESFPITVRPPSGKFAVWYAPAHLRGIEPIIRADLGPPATSRKRFCLPSTSAHLGGLEPHNRA